MFTSSQTFGSHKLSAMAYRDVGAVTALDGASPHKLVSLLYEALATQIANARGALTRHDLVEKGRAIGHAVRVLDEGLKTPLDLVAGGQLAANLHSLYEYMVQRLTLANLRNDDAALFECARLTETLREGWEGIAGEVHSARRASA